MPELNPVGVYDSLFYQSFVVNNPKPAGLGVQSLIPASPPNVILTAFEQQDVTGTPMLTVFYPGSKVKSFILRSFYFGCAVNAGADVADTATQCTILVGGFKSNQEVAVTSYTFTPPTVVDLDAPMIKAVLPDDFNLLQNVTIIQIDPTLQVLNLDNITYTTTS